ncbi:MAG: Ig-like domain-containing protein [Spirochaetaceae bacterium]|jgi:hypothetical protein|nr:Ig-like domain-containing protein [Spirochaetaceae bacterium]
MKQCTVFIILVLFLSCDILRSAPFEITSWSPGEGYRDINGGIAISVQFSRGADRNSVERSFEFSEDGVKSNGRIVWSNDDKLVFTPSTPPQSGHDYAVVINTDAQDTQGVSLEKRFEGRWTTRPLDTGGRPSILATLPLDGGVIAPGYTTVAIEFSTVVPINACNNHISFSPQIKGSWTLDYSGKKAQFTPDAAWRHGTDYKMTVGAAFESSSGNTLGQELVIHFAIDGETVPPELTGVAALEEDGSPVKRGGADYTLTEISTENSGWESVYKLLFSFSENIDVSSFKKAVTIEPSLSCAVDTKQAFSDTVVLSFIDRPVFQQRYLITLDSGIKDESGNESAEAKSYRIYVDGKRSKPPELKKLKIAGNGQSCVYEMGDNFAVLQDLSDDAAACTLWFEAAEGTEINLYSLMECFSVSSTNNVVSFSPLSIEYGAADGDCAPVIITGILTCKNTESGIVTVSVGAGLLDSYGNKQTEARRIVLLK